MERVLETNDMGEIKNMFSYDDLKSLDLVNKYFLNRALGLCSSGKILDVGCGSGKMLRNVIGDYEKYGVDINIHLIKKAKMKDLNSSYIVGNSNNFPYESETFDLVMCHSVIHHLEDPRKTIDEILRVVKPGGAIFIRDLIRPVNEEILDKLFLDYFAMDYNKQNKILFRDSLKSSFSINEWGDYFSKGFINSNILFYNLAERFSNKVNIDVQKRKLKEMEFVFSRLMNLI